jgi:hypothetical protein
MLIALYALAVTELLLVLHLVALPLTKKRPVLLRGAEAFVAGGLLTVCLSFANPWLLLLLVLQVGIAAGLRPWVVFGIDRTQVDAALNKAGTMVRQSVTAQGRRYLLSGGSARIVSLGGQIIIFRLPNTKKIALFKNVLRKTLQNYTLQ